MKTRMEEVGEIFASDNSGGNQDRGRRIPPFSGSTTGEKSSEGDPEFNRLFADRITNSQSKMNDLMTTSFLNYVELKKQALKDLQTEELNQSHTAESLNPEDEQNLSFFFQEVDQIKTQMAEITTLLQDLQSLNEEAKSAITFGILRDLRVKLDSKISSITRKVMAVKSRIESLSKSNIKNRQLSVAFSQGTAVDRTRIAVTNGLRFRFKDMLGDFASIRDKLVDDHKDDLTRKCYYPTQEAPREEMVNQINVFCAEETKKTSLDSECKERNEAAMDIKKSLDRLQQVFLDMAVLVEEQGEQIDDIEKNMESSGMYINGGTNSLYYAQQMKKKGKRKVYLIWAVGFIILLVCLIAALSS
ncbi:hypothetical protein V2J09_021823 [Rumex salicifolius]